MLAEANRHFATGDIHLSQRKRKYSTVAVAWKFICGGLRWL